MFVYPAWLGSLKERQKLFIVCLSAWAWKFKSGKKLRFFVYPAGPGCLRDGKCCLLIVYMAGLGSLSVAKSWRFLSSMAGKFKRKVQRYFCLENPAGSGSLREAKSLFFDCLSGRASKS